MFNLQRSRQETSSHKQLLDQTGQRSRNRTFNGQVDLQRCPDVVDTTDL